MVFAAADPQQVGAGIVRAGIGDVVRVFKQPRGASLICVVTAADVQRLVDVANQMDDVAQSLGRGDEFRVALQHGNAVGQTVDDIVVRGEPAIIDVFEGA